MTAISSIPSMAFPKARAITDALLAPPQTTINLRDPQSLRAEVAARLQPELARSPACGELRVDSRLLHLACSGRSPTDLLGPFEWSPDAARRPIGLEVVRAWVAGTSSLSAATADVIERIASRRRSHAREAKDADATLSFWLRSLPAGARGVVQAEALRWATHLITALDWPAITQRPVTIGYSEVVTEPRSNVVIAGRADLRVQLDRGTTEGRGDLSAAAFFVMGGGHPTSSSPLELGLVAVASALARRDPVPTRVVGWWPECGRALVVGIDDELVSSTIGAVASALSRAPSLAFTRPYHRTRPSARTIHRTRETGATGANPRPDERRRPATLRRP